MYSTSVTILIPTLAVILLSARHYQIASDYSGQVARALCNQKNLLLTQICGMLSIGFLDIYWYSG